MCLNGYLMMPSLLHAHGYEGFGTVVPEQLVDGMRGVGSDSRRSQAGSCAVNPTSRLITACCYAIGFGSAGNQHSSGFCESVLGTCCAAFSGLPAAYSRL
jgi:hypothetical protein